MAMDSVRRIVERILVVSILPSLISQVSGTALVEVDLLHYSSNPNECCDGSKWIIFGPLKCNECDPYFNICLQQSSSNDKQCVKTSRENNVNDKDLQDGNIQPNHLTLPLNTWQGALKINVKVMDYDSISQDDLIDHVTTVYTGSPSLNAQTVYLNGSVVRLSVRVKVTCNSGYYGNNCAIQCRNTTTSFCDQTGRLVCKHGYTDSDCSLQITTSLPTIPTTSATSSNTVHITTKMTMIPHSGSSSVPVHRTTTDKTITTLSSTSSPTTTVSTTDLPTQSATSKQSSTAMKTSTLTTQFATTEQPKTTTATPNIITSSPSKITKTTPSQTTYPSSNTSTKRPVIITTTANLSSSSNAVDLTTTNTDNKPTTAQKTHTNTQGPTTTVMKSTTLKLPTDRHKKSCIALKGKYTDIQGQITDVVLSLMSSNDDFTEKNQLSVSDVTIDFVTQQYGIKVTEVWFVVKYGEHVIPSSQVNQALQSTSLPQMLSSQNLTQYTEMAFNQQQPSDTQSWVKEHVPVVAGVSAGVAVLVALLVAVVLIRGRRKRYQAEDKIAIYKNDKSSTTSSVEFPNSFDGTTNIENPLYDFGPQQHYGGSEA